MPDALPAATLPIYPGLEQAPSMLDCIPGGLVRIRVTTTKSTKFENTNHETENTT